MNSSESTSKSAPSDVACFRAARALAALPVTSPTTGLSCASVIVSWDLVMIAFSPPRAIFAIAQYEHNSDETHALGDGEQPRRTRDQQCDADRCRSHVLDPADLGIVVGGHAIR